MSEPTVRLVMLDYDYLAPLYGGDVVPTGVTLRVDRATPMGQVLEDHSILAGELSFSRYLIALARGDRSFVGIPFFAIRAFQHRAFYVRRESGLRDLSQLAGKRIGTNEWPATGNTWTRSLLRQEGVKIADIRWWVGPIDDPSGRGKPDALPSFAQPVSGGRTLGKMLLDGELDALMVPVPPKGFSTTQGPVVRMFPDYRAVERAHYRRRGFYPGGHIIGVRRELFDRDPRVTVAIYDALERSRARWLERRKDLAELTPWTQAEIEDTVELMGEDWRPNGVAANQPMIAALCEEEYAQALVERPIDPTSVFAEFEAVRLGR